jgi:hypothetical protein
LFFQLIIISFIVSIFCWINLQFLMI